MGDNIFHQKTCFDIYTCYVMGPLIVAETKKTNNFNINNKQQHLNFKTLSKYCWYAHEKGGPH